MSTPFPAIQFRGEFEEVFDGASTSSESGGLLRTTTTRLFSRDTVFQPIYWQRPVSEIVTCQEVLACTFGPAQHGTAGMVLLSSLPHPVLAWSPILWSDLNDFKNYILWLSQHPQVGLSLRPGS